MRQGRILLTGATGYIGSRLLRELEAGGCTVRSLARQPAIRQTATFDPEGIAGRRIEFAVGRCGALNRLVAALLRPLHKRRRRCRFAPLDSWIWLAMRATG